MDSDDLALRLARLRETADTLGTGLDELRNGLADLERALFVPSPPEAPAVPRSPEPPDRDEENEGDGYLGRIQARLHDLVRGEMAAIEREGFPSPAPAAPGMVCPSCGTVADRNAESCPQCGEQTEPCPDGGGRAFPLSSERVLRLLHDRFGWFIKSSDKAMHYADRKGDYEKAIGILEVLVRFMEENLALLKSTHREFRLALAYAYLGRCYFQGGRVKEALEKYKKGLLLKAGNSYTCEIGLTAVYRDLVRAIGDAGAPLSRASHPYLSDGEIAALNRLGMRTAD